MFKNASHTPSFIVVVPCYKSGGSILNFFELVLKTYTRGVPNRTAIFQLYSKNGCFSRLHATSFTSCLSSQEAKGPISLSVNIADICIPSQIICDTDPKILDTFDVFQDHSLQSIWSMDLLDPFPSYLHHITFGRMNSLPSISIDLHVYLSEVSVCPLYP